MEFISDWFRSRSRSRSTSESKQGKEFVQIERPEVPRNNQENRYLGSTKRRGTTRRTVQNDSTKVGIIMRFMIKLKLINT